MPSRRIRCAPACLKFPVLIATLILLTLARAQAQPHRVPIRLQPTDVLPTGNEWISLPDIRADDGALGTFNAISMRERGLLQVNGDHASPVLEPYFEIAGKPAPLHGLSWDLLAYWIPTGHATIDGLDVTLTWCAPPGSRAAALRLSITNRRAQPADLKFGVRASWGSLSRVTYVPVELHGTLTSGLAPWVESGEVFSYITDDTRFAWSLLHPSSKGDMTTPPVSRAPAVDANRTMTLQPGQNAESVFILGVGVEEFSAAHNARALEEILDRDGFDQVLDRAAAWCLKRTRTTGKPDLDMLMNRNFLFTELYAWGRTIDTEQVVGVTSRSPRYYVSAAYWDRDAMLWSFPALLDIDPEAAASALDYALGIQLRNTGTHSRFIDGIVLEDGFQLDEAVAPAIALAAYVKKTGNTAFLDRHRSAVDTIRDRILSRYDHATGLYSSLQDSQDEYQKLPFLTYDNALTWRALLDLADLYTRLNDPQSAKDLAGRANALHEAILAHSVSPAAPGASGTIFASATDGHNFVFTDIPPGSLMKLPLLGFIAQDDPLFVRTYDWLHSKNYRYSYAGQPYGLPGSYRLPFTTSWTVADHLLLRAGHDKALKILRASNWDGGIITEGVDPSTARMDQAGRAFATAAGYMAHAICEAECTDKLQPPASNSAQ